MSQEVLVVVAQAEQDARRDAGLRGEEWSAAAWRLGLVFLAAVVVLAVVLLLGRRRDRSSTRP